MTEHITDLLDVAADVTERMTADSIKQILAAPKREHDGHCVWCRYPSETMLCGPECREDFERNERAKR